MDPNIPSWFDLEHSPLTTQSKMSQLTLEQSSHSSSSASTHLQNVLLWFTSVLCHQLLSLYWIPIFALQTLSVFPTWGNHIMPLSPSLPIPLLPVILIPLHPLYHQHPDSFSSTHHMQQQLSLSSYYYPYPSCCLTGLKGVTHLWCPEKQVCHRSCWPSCKIIIYNIWHPSRHTECLHNVILHYSDWCTITQAIFPPYPLSANWQ